MSISDAFGAIKELKIRGLENIYIQRYIGPAKIFAELQTKATAICQLPRYPLEVVAFGGIILVILYLMNFSGNLNNSLPILSAYVFAGYRLMPALQQIYNSLTQLTHVRPALDKLYFDLKSLKTFNLNQEQKILSFNKEIKLKNVHYNYPNSSKTTLKNINLVIPNKKNYWNCWCYWKW